MIFTTKIPRADVSLKQNYFCRDCYKLAKILGHIKKCCIKIKNWHKRENIQLKAKGQQSRKVS